MNQQTASISYVPYGAPIGLDDALAVMAAARSDAQEKDWPVAIAIVDSGGHVVATQRLDQAQHAAMPLAVAKAESAVAYRRSTTALEDALGKGGINLRLLAMTQVLPAAGGLPLVRNGVIVGAIGVSGMQAAQDEEIARAGIAALAGSVPEAAS